MGGRAMPRSASAYRQVISGAAAWVLLLATIAAQAVAQSGGERGSARTRPARDSFFFRQILPPGVPIDSVMTLIHALHEEAFGSPGWLTLRATLDSLVPALPRVKMLMRGGPPPPPAVKGWIGIDVGGVPRHEMISAAGDVVRYMTYPPIISVDPDSPAQRAGIAPGDLLVAYDGNDVVDQGFNVTRLFVPDKKLVVRVQRDGEMKDYSVKIAKLTDDVLRHNLELSDPAPLPLRIPFGRMDEHELEGTHRMEMPKPFVVQRDDGAGLVMMRPPGFFVLAADGLFGARMSTVSAALSRALKLDTGVLVNDVSDGTPAERAGLKAGDVIVAAAAKPVATVEQLRRVIARQLREQSIELQVVRDKKARRITVTW